MENSAIIRSEYELAVDELLVGGKTSIGGQKCCKIFDTSNILTTLKLPQTKKYRDTLKFISIVVHSLSLVHFCLPFVKLKLRFRFTHDSRKFTQVFHKLHVSFPQLTLLSVDNFRSVLRSLKLLLSITEVLLPL